MYPLDSTVARSWVDLSSPSRRIDSASVVWSLFMRFSVWDCSWCFGCMFLASKEIFELPLIGEIRVPNIVTEAVAVSLLGFFSGPFFATVCSSLPKYRRWVCFQI